MYKRQRVTVTILSVIAVLLGLNLVVHSKEAYAKTVAPQVKLDGVSALINPDVAFRQYVYRAWSNGMVEVNRRGGSTACGFPPPPSDWCGWEIVPETALPVGD